MAPIVDLRTKYNYYTIIYHNIKPSGVVKTIQALWQMISRWYTYLMYLDTFYDKYWIVTFLLAWVKEELLHLCHIIPVGTGIFLVELPLGKATTSCSTLLRTGAYSAMRTQLSWGHWTRAMSGSLWQLQRAWTLYQNTSWKNFSINQKSVYILWIFWSVLATHAYVLLIF